MTETFIKFALPRVSQVESSQWVLEEGAIPWVSEKTLKENFCFQIDLKLCRLGSFRSIHWETLVEAIREQHQKNDPVCVSINASVNYLKHVQHLEHVADSLRALQLSINRLSRLDGDLDKLTQLVVLDLSNNGLTEIHGLHCLKRLRSLRLEQNRIQQIDGLDSLKRLVHLSLRLNRIQVVENLKSQQCLEMLDLSDNEVHDALHLCFVPSLRKLNLSNNKLADLEEARDIVLSLEGLEDLMLFGNPIETEDLYKVYLLVDAPEIKRFDMMAVDGFLRSQLEHCKRQSNMDEIVEATSHAYMSVIESEKSNQNSVISRLNHRKKAINDSITVYTEQMERELEDCLNFIQSLSNDPEKLKRSVLASDQGLVKFRDLIACKERDRNRYLNEQRDIAQRQEREAAQRRARETSFDEKLLALSKYKPELWRELKRLELHTSLTEERSEQKRSIEVERRRTEARERLTQRFASRGTELSGPFAKITQRKLNMLSIGIAPNRVTNEGRETETGREGSDYESTSESVATTPMQPSPRVQPAAEQTSNEGKDDDETGDATMPRPDMKKARQKTITQRLFSFRRGS